MDVVGSPVPSTSTAPGMHITIRHQLAATVVSVEGVAAGDTPDADIDEELSLLCEGAAAVVVDLNGLTLLDREVVRRLLTRLRTMLASSGGRLIVVCRRSTARGLLRAWHLQDRADIFPSVDAALH